MLEKRVPRGTRKKIPTPPSTPRLENKRSKEEVGKIGLQNHDKNLMKTLSHKYWTISIIFSVDFSLKSAFPQFWLEFESRRMISNWFEIKKKVLEKLGNNKKKSF